MTCGRRTEVSFDTQRSRGATRLSPSVPIPWLLAEAAAGIVIVESTSIGTSLGIPKGEVPYPMPPWPAAASPWRGGVVPGPRGAGALVVRSVDQVVEARNDLDDYSVGVPETEHAFGVTIERGRASPQSNQFDACLGETGKKRSTI